MIKKIILLAVTLMLYSAAGCFFGHVRAAEAEVNTMSGALAVLRNVQQNLTGDQLLTLNRHRNELLAQPSLASMAAAISDYGLSPVLNPVVENFSLEGAKFAVRCLSRPDPATLEADLAQFESVYRQQMVRLAVYGVGDDLIYRFALELDTWLAGQNISDRSSFDSALVSGAASLLLKNEFAPLRDALLKMYDIKNLGDAMDKFQSGEFQEVEMMRSLLAGNHLWQPPAGDGNGGSPGGSTSGGGSGGGAPVNQPGNQPGNAALTALSDRLESGVYLPAQPDLPGIKLTAPAGLLTSLGASQGELRAGRLTAGEAGALQGGTISGEYSLVCALEINLLLDGKEYSGSLPPGKEIAVKIDLSSMSGIDFETLGLYVKKAGGAFEYAGDVKIERDAGGAATGAAAVKHLSTYAIMSFNKKYADMDGHWAERDVEIMTAKHIAKGVDNSHFDPQSSITRAQFAALLVRAVGVQADLEQEIPFKDVTKDKWYYNEVLAACRAGLVKGYGGEVFGPDDPVTREQVAVIAARALEKAGKAPAMSGNEVEQRLSLFSDRGQVQDWAREGVAAASKAGIVRGFPGGAFMPLNGCTRAEGVVMLKRLYGLL